MSSKRRLRRKACSSKISYQELAWAATAAKRRSKATGTSIGFYKCPFSSHYHIGHTPSHVKRAKIAGMAGKGEGYKGFMLQGGNGSPLMLVDNVTGSKKSA